MKLISRVATQDKASLQREMEALRVTIAAREDENMDIERLRRDIRELEDVIQQKNESLERAADMEEELEELRNIVNEKEAALDEIDARNKADLADLDEQWRSSLAQAEDKIQILEEDLSEMEERFKATTEQLTEKIMETESLNQELQQVSIMASSSR
jgi:chromosome segregation ATPase